MLILSIDHEFDRALNIVESRANLLFGIVKPTLRFLYCLLSVAGSGQLIVAEPKFFKALLARVASK